MRTFNEVIKTEGYPRLTITPTRTTLKILKDTPAEIHKLMTEFANLSSTSYDGEKIKISLRGTLQIRIMNLASDLQLSDIREELVLTCNMQDDKHRKENNYRGFAIVEDNKIKYHKFTKEIQ